jgi:DnaJ-class molecular chaperone
MAIADYYFALSLSPAETSAAVRASYRDFVKLVDHGVGVRPRHAMEARQVAFDVLSDTAWRRCYDEARRRDQLPETTPVRQHAVASADSLLSPETTVRPSVEALRERLLRNFTQIGVPKAEHPESLTVEVDVSAVDRPKPCSVRVEFPVFEPCVRCAGQGRTDLFLCADCGGAGFVESAAGVEELVERTSVVERSLVPFGIDNLYLRLLLLVH